jgi:hypothetical protein
MVRRYRQLDLDERGRLFRLVEARVPRPGLVSSGHCPWPAR